MYGKAGILHLESIRTERAEADEMRTYAGSKNFRRIRTAVDGHGKRSLDFVIGDRSAKTTEKFWNKIKHHNMNRIASDYRKPYERHYPWGKAYSNQSGNLYGRRL
ncbi:hypothetical protein Barb6_00068 [Bacteroidales bacterium Barb6]|nr:hypothetical protein Barb6_00068 [Bacteroidales bacterium Barb6]